MMYPAQMPFADDVRKYAFSPLQHLLNRKGEVVTTHPFIPTDEQQDAMDAFVDAMDLGDAGPKNNLEYVLHIPIADEPANNEKRLI